VILRLSALRYEALVYMGQGWRPSGGCVEQCCSRSHVAAILPISPATRAPTSLETQTIKSPFESISASMEHLKRRR
jgi:hypothetical protein